MVISELAAVLAASVAQFLDGFAPPERLVHRYDIACRGQSGAVIVEEQFNRSASRQTVTLTSFTPFRAINPVAATPELETIFARMARIRRVEWLCERRRALLVIEYVDRQSVERAARPEFRAGSVPITFGRAYLLLDEVGLRPESQPARSTPDR
jgi:hypothetical protein